MRLLSKILRVGLATEPLAPGGDDVLRLLHEVDARARQLFGRALAIREVDAGSCNGCELEISGLMGPVYDSERFGVYFVASPRHADLLLVTGPVTRNMAVPLVKVHHTCLAPSDLPLRLSAVCAASKLPSGVRPYQILFSAVASFALMQVAASVLLPVTPSPVAPVQSAAASRAGL